MANRPLERSRLPRLRHWLRRHLVGLLFGVIILILLAAIVAPPDSRNWLKIVALALLVATVAVRPWLRPRPDRPPAAD